MDIICDRCGHVFNRDQWFDGVLIEEYVNTYGTRCPECEHIILPISPPVFLEELKQREEDLKRIVLDKIKQKFLQGHKNGNS